MIKMSFCLHQQRIWKVYKEWKNLEIIRFWCVDMNSVVEACINVHSIYYLYLWNNIKSCKQCAKIIHVVRHCYVIKQYGFISVMIIIVCMIRRSD